jgi:F0F1-type ATP synthase assembly protein I
MKNTEWMGQVYIVMQLGLTIAGCVVFCFFLGRYIDRLLGTRGIFITIFILLGVLGGANVAYRQIKDVLEEEKKNKDLSDDA